MSEITERKKLQEEDGTYKEWYKRAKTITVETLPDFIRSLTEDFEHDYGTICHAMSAAAIAAANAIQKSPQGGITGFQAGCVMWGFISHWGIFPDGNPLRLLNLSDMLYPQMEHKFTAISGEDWAWLKEEAASLLATTEGHPNVRAHWQSIVDGIVPFGMTMEDA